MTVCGYCLNGLAARSKMQLQNRKRNIANNPEAMFARCPKCGGIEWATTAEMVQPDPPLTPWARLWRRRKGR